MISTGTFSMKTFMELVNKGNWHFTLKKSDLKDLIEDALMGEYDKSKGADLRTLTRRGLMEVQAQIWREGIGGSDTPDPWTLKKTKYKLALGYLAKTLFQLDEADALLVGSYKDGWQEFMLRAPKRFVSAKSISESKLHQSGSLNNRFASEVCIPKNGLIGDWDLGHKFYFGGPMAFRRGKLASGGALKNQGFGNNIYCFERPLGERYMSMFDADVEGTREFAFTNDAGLSYIRAYKDGQPAPTQPWASPNFNGGIDLVPPV
jgi:hypothetical protein